MRWLVKIILGLVIVMLLPGWGQAQDIHEAVLSGDINLVQDLIAADSSLVNAANRQGFTPLRLAVSTGNMEIIALLLDRSAKTDDLHAFYGSLTNHAFVAACQKGGGPEVVQFLIERCLPFDAGQVDPLGMTPLDWLVQFSNNRMASLALEHGADVNHISQSLGRPPLIGAVSKGNDELVARVPL